jgi:hypothetical protein
MRLTGSRERLLSMAGQPRVQDRSKRSVSER